MDLYLAHHTNSIVASTNRLSRKGRRARRWGSGSLSEMDMSSRGVEDNEEDADPGSRSIPVQSAGLFEVHGRIKTLRFRQAENSFNSQSRMKSMRW